MIPDFVKQREENGEGFDLYFAGSQSKETEDWMLAHGSCRLQSQLNDRTNIKRWTTEPNSGKLFIDSGAYTAHTLGKKVNVDEYIQYINSIIDKVHVFAQLDYIPGTDDRTEDPGYISWENYLYMRPRVKDPDKLIPIYHQGENPEWLINMLEYVDDRGNRIPYIGFGALVGSTTNDKKLFFDKCFSIISKSSNPNVKVHAMGMTSLALLETYPFYSADSTGWIMTGAAGNIMTPYGMVDASEKNQFTRNNIRNLQNGEKVLDWLEKNGLNIDELVSNYRKRMLCNLIYLTDWAKNYRFKGSIIHKVSLF